MRETGVASARGPRPEAAGLARRTGRVAPTILAMAAALACDATPRPDAPGGAHRLAIAHRLVDLVAPPQAPGDLPSAVLGAERRHVLREAPPEGEPVVATALELRAGPQELLLPRAFAAVPRAALRFLLPPEPGVGSWREVAAVEATLAPGGADGRPLAAFSLGGLAEELLGRRAAVRARPLGLRPEAVAPVETPPLRIPEDAVLELAMGVPEALQPEGPVAFRVSACEPAETGSCRAIYTGIVEPTRPGGRGWSPARVSLDALAGRTLRLRFDASAPAAAGRAAVGLWANPTILAPRKEPPPPNLVLLSLDTLAAGHLELYGYDRATAPFLARFFGEGGVRVRHFTTSEVHTGPSHMSLLTSLPPSAHGVMAGSFERLPRSAATLATSLRDAGYATGAVTENGAMYMGGGFERGFDEYRENRDATLKSLSAGATLDQAAEWARSRASAPFFLFAHTYHVHTPFDPEGEAAALFADDGRPPDPPGLPPELGRLPYDREIRELDRAVERFVASLREAGLLADTLLVVTSDHGEEFLQHGFIGHGAQLHAEVTQVPLLFAGPGLPAGHIVETPLAQADLAPTLLEWLGAPPLPQARGRSFRPQLSGAIVREPPRAAFSEAWFPTGRRAGMVRVRVDPPTFAVRRGPYKLIRSGTGAKRQERLYRLDLDPGETRDRAAEEPEALRELSALLDDYVADARALRAQLTEGSREGGESRPLEPSPERVEMLRGLGYIE